MLLLLLLLDVPVVHDGDNVSIFLRYRIKRSECGPDDVEFDIKFCGICHTDVHIANNDLGTTQYPCVPGHELAGIVSKVVLKK